MKLNFKNCQNFLRKVLWVVAIVQLAQKNAESNHELGTFCAYEYLIVIISPDQELSKSLKSIQFHIETLLSWEVVYLCQITDRIFNFPFFVVL